MADFALLTKRDIFVTLEANRWLFNNYRQERKMPVFIYKPDAFEKMVKIEGEDYRRRKSKESFGNCSFDAFLEVWEAIDKKYPDFRNDKPAFGIDVKGNGAIYGLGGWNRYIVLNTGEIMLHRYFLTSIADKEIMNECHKHLREWSIEERLETMLQRIRKIGFRIFPDDLRKKENSG